MNVFRCFTSFVLRPPLLVSNGHALHLFTTPPMMWFLSFVVLLRSLYESLNDGVEGFLLILLTLLSRFLVSVLFYRKLHPFDSLMALL